MSKIAIFGGTFDPIHNGHLKTAKKLVEIRQLDKLIFIPCNISPHKMIKETSSATHRIEMVKLAIKNFPFFDYSDYEIKKGDISYTLDTLQHFSELYDDIELVIGYDNIINFDSWKKPDKIVKLARLIVMKRTLDKEPEVKHKYWFKATFVDTPIVDVSATEIRRRLKNRESISDLVPSSVEQYIIANNLYS